MAGLLEWNTRHYVFGPFQWRHSGPLWDGLSHIQQGARCIYLPFMCKKVVSAKQCQAAESSPARNIPRSQSATHSKQKHAAIYHFVGNKIVYFVINYVVLQYLNKARTAIIAARARQACSHACAPHFNLFLGSTHFRSMTKAIFQEPFFPCRLLTATIIGQGPMQRMNSNWFLSENFEFSIEHNVISLVACNSQRNVREILVRFNNLAEFVILSCPIGFNFMRNARSYLVFSLFSTFIAFSSWLSSVIVFGGYARAHGAHFRTCIFIVTTSFRVLCTDSDTTEDVLGLAENLSKMKRKKWAFSAWNFMCFPEFKSAPNSSNPSNRKMFCWCFIFQVAAHVWRWPKRLRRARHQSESSILLLLLQSSDAAERCYRSIVPRQQLRFDTPRSSVRTYRAQCPPFCLSI